MNECTLVFVFTLNTRNLMSRVICTVFESNVLRCIIFIIDDIISISTKFSHISIWITINKLRRK